MTDRNAMQNTDQLPDRRIMHFKDVTKRIPELMQFTNDHLIRASDTHRPIGVSDIEGRNELIDQFKPVHEFDSIPQMATDADAQESLNARQKTKWTSPIPAGSKVALRLDIPAYSKHGVWIPTIHDAKTDKVISHVPAVHITNAHFRVDRPGNALLVAQGGPKNVHAKIFGEYQETHPDEIMDRVKQHLTNPHSDWSQVGYDPERHSYFYKRGDHRQAVVSGDEVMQLGPLVIARKPVSHRFDEPMGEKRVMYSQSKSIPSGVPPIPEGHTRLTHFFANPDTKQAFLSGAPFKYGRSKGFIQSTTDSFSNNDDIHDILHTGKTGPFDRSSFGNHVLIMDVPHQEHRMHMIPHLSSGEVHNGRIAGVYDRESKQFHRNPSYGTAPDYKSNLQQQVSKNRPGSSFGAYNQNAHGINHSGSEQEYTPSLTDVFSASFAAHIDRYAGKFQLGLFDENMNPTQPQQPQATVATDTPRVASQALATKPITPSLFDFAESRNHEPEFALSSAPTNGWNEDKHPRWKAGDNEHHGGQFSPKQKNLFDTHGDQEQLFLFGDRATPDTLEDKISKSMSSRPAVEQSIALPAEKAKNKGLSKFIRGEKSAMPKPRGSFQQAFVSESQDTSQADGEKPESEDEFNITRSLKEKGPISLDEFRNRHFKAILWSMLHQHDADHPLRLKLESLENKYPEHFESVAKQAELGLRSQIDRKQEPKKKNPLASPEDLDHSDNNLLLGIGDQESQQNERFERELSAPDTRKFLLKFALQKTNGDHSSAEDIVQNAMSTAFKNRHSYDPSRPFKSWIGTILQRTAINDARDKKAKKRGGGESLSSLDAATGEDGSRDLEEIISGDRRRGEKESVVNQDQIDELRSEIDKLPESEREVMRLHAQGHSKAEITRRLNALAKNKGERITATVVGQRVRSAMEKLLDKLGSDNYALNAAIDRYRDDEDRAYYDMCMRVYRYTVFGEKDRYASDSDDGELSSGSGFDSKMFTGTPIAERPEKLSVSHPMHLQQLARNPETLGLAQKLHQVGMGLHGEWKKAQERQQRMGNDFQSPYHHVDWGNVKSHLDALNNLHRNGMSKGINVANIANYNGTVPKWLVPKLAGGRRFLDPSLLAGKWDERNVASQPSEPRRPVWNENLSAQLSDQHRAYPSIESAQDAAKRHGAANPGMRFDVVQHPEGRWYVGHWSKPQASQSKASALPAATSADKSNKPLENQEQARSSEQAVNDPAMQNRAITEKPPALMQNQHSLQMQFPNNPAVTPERMARHDKLMQGWDNANPAPTVTQLRALEDEIRNHTKSSVSEPSKVDAFTQQHLSNTQIKQQGFGSQLSRPFNAGMNRATISFQNELHRNLYDLAARARNNANRSNGFNPLQLKPTDSLEQKIMSHPDIQNAIQGKQIDEQGVRQFANEVHSQAKSQMKGVGEGESRSVSMPDMPWKIRPDQPQQSQTAKPPSAALIGSAPPHALSNDMARGEFEKLNKQLNDWQAIHQAASNQARNYASFNPDVASLAKRQANAAMKQINEIKSKLLDHVKQNPLLLNANFQASQPAIPPMQVQSNAPQQESVATVKPRVDVRPEEQDSATRPEQPAGNTAQLNNAMPKDNGFSLEQKAIKSSPGIVSETPEQAYAREERKKSMMPTSDFDLQLAIKKLLTDEERSQLSPQDISSIADYAKSKHESERLEAERHNDLINRLSGAGSVNSMIEESEREIRSTARQALEKTIDAISKDQGASDHEKSLAIQRAKQQAEDDIKRRLTKAKRSALAKSNFAYAKARDTAQGDLDEDGAQRKKKGFENFDVRSANLFNEFPEFLHSPEEAAAKAYEHLAKGRRVVPGLHSNQNLLRQAIDHVLRNLANRDQGMDEPESQVRPEDVAHLEQAPFSAVLHSAVERYSQRSVQRAAQDMSDLLTRKFCKKAS